MYRMTILSGWQLVRKQRQGKGTCLRALIAMNEQLPCHCTPSVARVAAVSARYVQHIPCEQDLRCKANEPHVPFNNPASNIITENHNIEKQEGAHKDCAPTSNSFATKARFFCLTTLAPQRGTAFLAISTVSLSTLPMVSLKHRRCSDSPPDCADADGSQRP